MTHISDKIDRALLRKYDQPGPRYTSYPTVPEWSADFGPDDYRKALVELGQSNDPLSLYFHIPFCRSRCWYCGCTTVVSGSSERADSYLDRLEHEMTAVAGIMGSRKKAIQLHWGGGTPTFLTLEQIQRLFAAIAARFEISPDAEIAIEVDPRVTSFDQAVLLRRLGFNRVSMGVQDLTPRVQEAIGRNQTADQTWGLYKRCRELGFSGINIDLIYGLPFQTVANMGETIRQVIDMGADRVAVYSFAYLPDAKAHQKRIDTTALPTAAMKYDLFATAVEKFLEAGYIQIGMDHFARPEDELAKALAEGRLHRNFMGYTVRPASNSLGFGMSAISEMAGAFAQNVSGLTAYEQAVDTGGLATFRGYRLSQDDIIRQSAILSLMCNFILPFKTFDEKHNIDSLRYFASELEDLKPFIEDGLVGVTDTAVQVLPRGRVFVRNIAMVFDAFLRRKGKDGRQIFSRTI